MASIELLQRWRKLRIVGAIASEFDDRGNGVSVPIWQASTFVNPNQMRQRCEGRFANVALVVQFVPELIPSSSRALTPFECPKRPREDRRECDSRRADQPIARP
jgi:hypothetical protein